DRLVGQAFSSEVGSSTPYFDGSPVSRVPADNTVWEKPENEKAAGRAGGKPRGGGTRDESRVSCHCHRGQRGDPRPDLQGVLDERLHHGRQLAAHLRAPGPPRDAARPGAPRGRRPP